MRHPVLLAPLLCALVGTAAAAPAPATPAAPKTSSVTFPSGAEQASGLLALPSTPGKHPAVIVVHEWWGLNDFAKDKARHFAERGYVTLAVDLYRGKVAADADTAHQLARGLPDDRRKRDMAAAFTWLAARPDVDPSRIAVVGWCMGGGIALDLALDEPKLAGAAMYYGRVATDAAAIARIKAQVLGNFGAEDKGIPPESVEAFAQAAKKAGVRIDVKIYPGVGHAFASSKDPKVFHEAEAKDADARTDAFLERVLGKGAAK